MKATTKLVPLFALGLALVLALSISIGRVLGQEASTGGGPAAPDDPSYLYLPTASKAPNTIFGHVTDDGVAAEGVGLNLWFYNGSTWSGIMETTTDANGDYFFRGMLPLSPGQKYAVEYFNVVNPNRLYLWDTRQLTDFSNMSVVNIGNFDIANVEATSPASGTLVRLPGNFTWTPRPATPSDSYEFDIFDIGDYNPAFNTTPLGYVGSYNLGSLPTGFQYCIPYFWGITVYGPDGGSGFSFWAYLTTLYNATPSGIHGCVSEKGVKKSGISLDLRKATSTSDVSVEKKTTNTNGYFAFTGKPTLNPGEEYYVAYSNTTNSSRLRFHGTQTLYSYASGSSVHIGDFDIANIPLVSPASGSTVPLPTIFSWTPRPDTLLDDYEFDLLDPVDRDPWFWTVPSLGYEDHYTLAGLPSLDFSYGYPYIWNVWTYDLFDGFGYSYYANEVYFTPTGVSLGPAVPALQPDMELLRLERARRAAMSEPQAGQQVRLRLHPNIDFTRSMR